MIPRYTRKEMGDIWSDENKFKKYLEVELAVCEAWNKAGVIPDRDLETIKKKARVDIARIEEIERVTRHDVIAFVEQVGSTIGPAGSYFHFGLTSSDVIDTASSLILVQAGNVLAGDLKKLRDVLKKNAKKYKNIPVIGRTHGIHAEPVTLGFKFAGWYFETERNLKRMLDAIEEISVAKISGAVGNYAHLDPGLEKNVCRKLGLRPENFSTQIIPRDRHAAFISALAVIAASLEKFALQVRLMQQTELSELAEQFAKGQKGSSAMPHKRNPILCERICGLARVIKKNVSVALENVALWHERDISHSSAERIIFPASTILLDYIINQSIEVFSNLEVYPSKMKDNIMLTHGVVFSQRILLALCKKGLSRKEAYEIVQKNAMRSYNEKTEFLDLLLNDGGARKFLSESEIRECFDVKWYLRHMDSLFKSIQ